jgi:hypothetical protein
MKAPPRTYEKGLQAIILRLIEQKQTVDAIARILGCTVYSVRKVRSEIRRRDGLSGI